MSTDVLLYESGLIVMIAAVIAMAVVMRKLTMIVKKKQLIWLLPVAAGVVLAAALGAHAYASFSVMPKLSAQISMLSSPEVIMDSAKLDAIKSAAMSMKSQMIGLKAFSFTCFFLAALILLVSNAIYMRWISK